MNNNFSFHFPDWGPMVDVVGFCFLNLAQEYKPPRDLMQWLKAGPPPIYVGFGSLVSPISTGCQDSSRCSKMLSVCILMYSIHCLIRLDESLSFLFEVLYALLNLLVW